MKLHFAMSRNSIYFFTYFLFRRVFSLFFMAISVLVMVQIPHFLSFIDYDKRNEQQQQMYS